MYVYRTTAHTNTIRTCLSVLATILGHKESIYMYTEQIHKIDTWSADWRYGYKWDFVLAERNNEVPANLHLHQ